MASDKTELRPSEYTCKCLNVRIVASTPPSEPPQYPRDANYTPVYVKDGDISIIHPQVTVRVPSKSEPIPGTSRYSRFTILTCLFCALPVYRVHHIFSPDVDGAESTLVPSEDWVEREIMKSATGWVGVHKDSIAGDKISDARKSSSYVSVFSLALPTIPDSPPSTQTSLANDEVLTPRRSPSPKPPKEYLADLPPLFLPPPFTLSHPIFIHLTEIATKESHELRAAAERRIADFVTAETAGLQMKEKEMKRQVEVLWKSFKHNLESVHNENPRAVSTTGRLLPKPKVNGVAGSARLSSSLAIRDFSPHPVSTTRHSISSSAPRVSALSASLATTQFHHPKEKRDESSSRNSITTDTHDLPSPKSMSSTLVAANTRGDPGSVLRFAPTTDDTLNTQASYRWLLNVDEEMTRHKESRAEVVRKSQEEAAKKSDAAGSSKKPTSLVEGTKSNSEASSSRSRDKAKKVKFVEPVVVTKEAETEDTSNDTEEPLMFPLELADTPEETAESSTSPQNTLPLLEQPSRPRARNGRGHNSTAHDVFSSLRPSSLPAPSHIRPIRSQPGVDSFSQSMLLSLPRTVAGNSHLNGQRGIASSSSSLTSNRPVRDNETKLVATDTPSHRGARKPEGKAWRTFTRMQDSKEGSDSSNIPEEGEDEAVNVTSLSNTPRTIGITTRNMDTSEDEDDMRFRGIPGSMPVNIPNRTKPRVPLSLASYRPTTILSTEETTESTTNQDTAPSNKPLSSTAIRKALYTERDRLRAIDPGALDFATEEDDEDDASEESDNEAANTPDKLGEKGRKHALKIIQARDDLPSEGMWRSLA